MRKILLVEDDLSLIEGLKFSLSKHNFDVTITRTVKEAEKCLNQNEYNLIILDLMLPDGSGFDICKSVRQTSNIPIIFLTASDEEVNIVMGLDIGGDDYITKPFRLNELISRINAALRRSNPQKQLSTELISNGIIVKLLEGRVIKNGLEIELTTVEYRLLCLFMQNPRIILSKEQIMQKLWDCRESFIDDNTLAVYISRLREKIEDFPKHPSFLVTIRGMGYKWNIL
ncbi:response regulator transcription factor [Desulfoscipio gibsoniae]|uniref:Stage 0 sporulation protein A homolog n=1 Tax=Desulfoscipio gibsoniae DSM 7213 TaxID=767817 RepID=R4KIT3_9FIRM|nr:response regulator transcription factor [Desulfoscipio gibsoniae]AGL01522.1 response regulator with CheY-like receiver domain and winged-helix DNA-binding domain [Desulfoscipio gibsoniae DSM 7213]